MTHSMTTKLFNYLVLAFLLFPTSTAFGPASSTRPLLKSFEQTHHHKSPSLTTSLTSLSYKPNKITDYESKEETSLLPLEYEHSPAAEIGKTSFQEIFDQVALEVVKHTCVPTDFESIDIGLTFPEHWRPTKAAVSSKEESEDVKLRLQSDLTRLGVFDGRPKMETIFEQLDCHLFGGRCRLQPGHLTQQFILFFSVWDEVIEEDPDFGKSSVDRLRRLLKARRKQDPKVVQTIVNEDALDACFMACWEEFFAHIESASAAFASKSGKTSLFFYDHFEEVFSTLLGGVDNEFDHLCILDPSEINIEEEWDNRIKSVGCLPVYELIRCNCGFSPTEEHYSELGDIKWLYSKIVRQINEIASIPKDIEDECGSLFTSTMLVNQFSFDETLEHFIDRFQSSVEEFDSVAAQLLAKKMSEEERCELESFLDAIRYSAVGFGDWHMPGPDLGMKGMRYNRAKLLHRAGKKVFNFCSFVGQDRDEQGPGILIG